MVVIEGVRMKAKALPKRQLVAIWRELSSKPFPRVQAFQLKDEDFDRVLRLRSCVEDEQRELHEWNTLLTPDGTDACVFNAEEASGFDYTIMVRENPYHRLGDIIRHELSHILRGDL